MSANIRNFLCTALLAWPAMALAQGATAQPVQKAADNGSTLLQIIERGGPMVYLLGALSVVCTILVILYVLTIRPGAVVNPAFLDMAEMMIRKGDYLGLAVNCRRTNQCVAQVLGRAMDFLSANPAAKLEEVRDVAQAEGSRQASLLTQRISYLADIAAVAPMVGLLGTVLGMIKSFNSISDGSFATARQMQLASGVSEALINTAGGLFICIPALVFYSIFRSKVQRLISEMETVVTHLLAMFAIGFNESGRSPRLPANLQDDGLRQSGAEAARSRDTTPARA